MDSLKSTWIIFAKIYRITNYIYILTFWNALILECLNFWGKQPRKNKKIPALRFWPHELGKVRFYLSLPVCLSLSSVLWNEILICVKFFVAPSFFNHYNFSEFIFSRLLMECNCVLPFYQNYYFMCSQCH